MTRAITVLRRTVSSIPQRSAADTWAAIVQLIAPDARSHARRDLDAVSGVACSCIADEALADDALVVFGAGPRVRIYCLYGDDAIEHGADVAPLASVPTDGDWRISLPCRADNLYWVARSLHAISARVRARSQGEQVDSEEGDRAQSDGASKSSPVMNRDAFFRR